MKWANEFSAPSEFPAAHSDNLQILVGHLHYVNPLTQRDNTAKHKISNNNIKTKTFFFSYYDLTVTHLEYSWRAIEKARSSKNM